MTMRRSHDHEEFVMGDTPKWMKRRVRERMKLTGEKYTKTLRDIKAEADAASQEQPAKEIPRP